MRMRNINTDQCTHMHTCIYTYMCINTLEPLLQITHWGRVTHICVGKLTNIGSDNGLSPGRRQAIIWTNAGILLIGPLGTNFSEFLIVIHTFSFNKMHLKMSSVKWRPFCLGLNVIIALHRTSNKPLSQPMMSWGLKSVTRLRIYHLDGNFRIMF